MYATLLLYLLIAIENPAMYRERGTSAFNMNGFSLMLQSGEISKYHVTAILINNNKHVRNIYSSWAFHDALREVERFLLTDGAYVFSLQDGLMLLMTRGDADAAIERLTERSGSAWATDEFGIYFDFSFLKVLPDYLPRDTEEFIDGIRGELRNLPKNEVRTLGIDELDRLHRRNSVRSMLDSAIRTNSMQMFLQPIMNAHTGKIEGAEALARLYDPYRKMYVSPVEFIPLAEESGLIIPLGTQMLEKACAFLSENSVPSLAWINVNVSPTQFADRNFFTNLSKMVESAGLGYDRIHLEITEEAYIADDSLTQQISFARDNRYQIVLDDFGTGYSSLSRVVENPFSNINLDTNFVWESTKSDNNILPELIQAFHKLGYTVTAEGVETPAMEQKLIACGCDYLQGYLYSKPLPAPEFSKFLLKSQFIS